VAIPLDDALSAAQREAVEHAAGPLLILGGAGTGKTATLLARFSRLVEHGTPPEAILILTHSSAAADALRGKLELAIASPYEQLAVMTVEGFAIALLQDESAAAGLDPFAAIAAPADRLALMLEHVDALPLGRHDLQGNPAAVLTGLIERIDRLKRQRVTAERFASWAAGRGEGEAAERDRDFAEIYRLHDRVLAQEGALDAGEVVLRADALLAERADVRDRAAARFAHLLVDELQELDLAQMTLLDRVASAVPGGNVAAAGDDDQTLERARGAGAKNLRDFAARHPGTRQIALEESFRCPQRILDAARAIVAPLPDRLGLESKGPPGGEVELWGCANERAQAQSVAADIERLVAHEGVAPEQIAVLVRSVRREGQAIAVALEERALPYRLSGAAAFFQRAEVRDVLAWLRLLCDPGDAGAVVRALARPPIELRAVDIARCTQIARRRKLDMVAALVAATESPQIPPEARERILVFLKLYRSAAAALDTTRPDLFVHRLIDRLGLRRQQLFSAQADVAERLVNLARLGELAGSYVRRSPQATAREFGRSIAAVADAGLPTEEAAAEQPPSAVRVMTMRAAKGLEFDHVYVLGLSSARIPGARRQAVEPIPAELLGEDLPPDTREVHVAEMRRLLHVAMTRARKRLVLAHPEYSDAGAAQPPSPFAEEAAAALGIAWQTREEELFGPDETLHATFRVLRDELLESVARTGARLGELRLDTDLDISHAVVRYLELIKLAALIERPADQAIEEALTDVNERLLQAVTAQQREIFLTSVLDDYVLDADRDRRRRAQAVAGTAEPSLEAFLPRNGEGLALSATDVETYRTCPLRYKFARVFRIPSEPTIHQRFGIAVHQVLERFHQSHGEGSLADMLGLLDASWRRGGFGDGEEERQLRQKATAALTRYHERFRAEPAEPVWFERSFAFRLGPHLLRGRVDRVDRLPEGGYELIDYKTGRPKTAAQLKDDVQLSLYAVGAREAWHLDAAQQAYYYVLDDEKVPVERDEHDRDWIREAVLAVGDGIMSQDFEPTPSYSACSMCDYRIVCPAAEK
jgi:DNA helicase-2/ATP-dependent DNA helicase PcrA